MIKLPKSSFIARVCVVLLLACAYIGNQEVAFSQQAKPLEDSVPSALLADPSVETQVLNLRRMRIAAQGIGPNHPFYARMQKQLSEAEAKLQKLLDAKLKPTVNPEHSPPANPFPPRLPEKPTPIEGQTQPLTPSAPDVSSLDPLNMAPVALPSALTTELVKRAWKNSFADSRPVDAHAVQLIEISTAPEHELGLAVGSLPWLGSIWTATNTTDGEGRLTWWRLTQKYEPDSFIDLNGRVLSAEGHPRFEEMPYLYVTVLEEPTEQRSQRCCVLHYRCSLEPPFVPLTPPEVLWEESERAWSSTRMVFDPDTGRLTGMIAEFDSTIAAEDSGEGDSIERFQYLPASAKGASHQTMTADGVNEMAAIIGSSLGANTLGVVVGEDTIVILEAPEGGSPTPTATSHDAKKLPIRFKQIALNRPLPAQKSSIGSETPVDVQQTLSDGQLCPDLGSASGSMSGIHYQGTGMPELQGSWLILCEQGTEVWSIDLSVSPTIERVLVSAIPFTAITADANGAPILQARDGNLFRIERPKANTASKFPIRLSETHIFQSLQPDKISRGFIEYSMNSMAGGETAPQRNWFYVPPASAIEYSPSEVWSFPEGSVFVQTLYNNTPIEFSEKTETRVLCNIDQQWLATSYRWNATQDDAYLIPESGWLEGSDIAVADNTWRTPTRQACYDCHTSTSSFIQGWSRDRLNRPHRYQAGSFDQLQALISANYIQLAPQGMKETAAGVKHAERLPIAVRAERAWPNITIPHPVAITQSPLADNTLLVASQTGLIVVLGTEDSQQTPPLFADLSGIVQFSEYGRGNESGLLGIAIHPKFKENGRWFGYYVTSYQQTGERKFRSVLSEFWSDPSAGYRFNPTSERVLLTTSQSQFDRHDGALQFGPDGFLYLGIGDGSVHPAQNVVQISSSYFGKLLRIDVDQRPSGSNYGIPLDNPWIDDHNTRPEIFAMGFRNIWGMDFHPENGTLFLADVGKEGWEEVNRITSGGNYGWKLREGSHSLESPEKEIPGESLVEDIIDPIWEYDHSNEWGKSITGGCFYSGKTIPALYNYYVYGDYVTGRIWALCYNFLTDKVVDHRSIEFQQSLPITTFGRRSDGEVFFAVPTSGGMLFRLTNADEE